MEDFACKLSKPCMRPAPRTKGANHWRVAAATTLLCLCVSSQGAEVTWPPPDDVRQRVDAAVSLVDRLRSFMPEPATSPVDLADALDYEFEIAISYVTRDIGYEPYIGVLRGPDGTAHVGSGNAWDQALLLASLIRSMGGSAQIVTGAMVERDAQRLLDRAFLPLQPFEITEVNREAVAGAFAEYDPELADYFNRAMDADPAGAADLASRSEQLSEELLALIRESGKHFPADRDADSLLRSVAQDYAWVRWRLGPTDEWVDVHPAFGDAPAPVPQVKTYVDATVPAEHEHRVSLQLFIERGVDDGKTEPELVPVMSSWEVPTASLYQDQIYLGMGPMSHDNRTESTVLIPALNGGLPPGAQVVTVLGLTAPPDAAASPAGAIFATASSKGGKAASVLESLSAGGEASGGIPRLLGIVLEVGIRSPQGERTIRRRVADLRGVEGEDFARAGTFQMIMDVHVGAGDPAAAYHNLLNYYAPFFRTAYPMLAMAREALPVEDLLKLRSYQDLGTPKWPDFDLFASGLVRPVTEQQTTFRDGPLLAARRTNVSPDGELLTVVDVLWNPSTVLNRNAAGQITVDNEAAIAQGIRETLIESAIAGRDSIAGWSTRSPRLVVADTRDLSGKAGWPEAALQAAREDLEAGYLLALTDDPEPHWWRLDPVTGQTLGMNRHGGSEVVGYAVVLIGIAISVTMFRDSVEACDVEFAGNRDMADCCIVGNLMMTYTTSAVTGAGGSILSNVSVKFSSGVGALASTLGWTAVDVASGTAIGSAGLVGDQCRASAGQL